MIAGLDSSADAPSLEAAAAARAAGVRLWIGYMATRPNVGLYATWQRWQFDIARSVGAMPVAMASGWDDPAALRQLAASWNVRLCLDCEGGGLRDDGAWVQAWLDAAGAGLYGGSHVHTGRSAAFHILAWYPGFDPGALWYPPGAARPPGPLGLQWWGTHTEFGRSVDRGWYDDWFLTEGGVEVLASDDPVVVDLKNSIFQAAHNVETNLTSWLGGAIAKTDADVAQVARVDVAALAAALVPHLQAVDEAKLAADLEAALPAPVASAVQQALAKALSGA